MARKSQTFSDFEVLEITFAEPPKRTKNHAIADRVIAWLKRLSWGAN